MIINNNISAINTRNNFHTNTAGKSMEKLSSGGSTERRTTRQLSISEKMRP